MERLGGTSEEDLEEAEEDMEMEVKEEDPAVSEDGSGGFFTQETAGGDQIQIQSIGDMGMGTMRRCRPKEEKERTKLRERHRRAITARILTGLRHHGNYNLRVRADINDVIAALAREAGWVVMPDGTTYPSSQAGRAAVATPASTMPSIAPAQTPPLRAISSSSSGSGLCRLKTVYTPPAVTSYDGRCRPSTENFMDSADDKQAMNVHGRMPERDFAGTPYVPVYVMLPLGVISMKCELVDPEGLMKQLRILKSINVDGVRIDCWWGIVEAHTPQEYSWHGYNRLFQIVRELKLKLQVTDEPPRKPERDYANTPYIPVYVMLPLGVINERCELNDPDGLRQQLLRLKESNVDGVMVDCWWGIVEKDEPRKYKWDGYMRLFEIARELNLKLQVVMSFHACGGNVGDDISIPLPNWVTEIGKSNPDIYFTDKQGWRNPECLSWGIDRKRVLRGRSAYEVYFDYMRSFQREFNIFFEKGDISEIEVGLGPSGELRYPSYPEIGGWDYPGIGEFQCYDKYLMKNLSKAAEASGYSLSEVVPKNTGTYNSMPYETGFFCDGGEYDRFYGRFFLGWYSQVLIDHADLILDLAKLTFGGTPIAAKISGIHWHYETASHAAELTAGFYNPINRDGYALIASMLKKHDATLNFTCVELRTCEQQENAFANPEGLVWQVLNAAWDVGLPVASENALLCLGRDGYNQILENAKPDNEPDGRHISAFTYLRLCPELMEESFEEFKRFVKRMHGEAVDDLEV